MIFCEKDTFEFSFFALTQRHGVNFIKVLQAAFTHPDPKSTKEIVKLPVFFALSGSEHKKAAHRKLMELTHERPYSFIRSQVFTYLRFRTLHLGPTINDVTALGKEGFVDIVTTVYSLITEKMTRGGGLKVSKTA